MSSPIGSAESSDRQHRRTLREARALKRSREADRDRGELFEASHRSFREYAAEWVESYQGNGRRGLTEQTRARTRRDLYRYAYPFIADHLGRSLASLTRADMRSSAAWLCNEKEQGKRLADATVRRVMAPVRACLSTAADDGLIRANPADGVKLPRREQIREDDEERRPFTREQLQRVPPSRPSRTQPHVPTHRRERVYVGARQQPCNSATSL